MDLAAIMTDQQLKTILEMVGMILDGCKGAPDPVIEILSPSSLRHDRLVKLNLYQRAGVQEYWIVDPENKAVQVFRQADGGSLQLHEDYSGDAIAKVNVLNGCFVELSRVFTE